MEGRRGFAAWAAVVAIACALAVGASGCGDEESNAAGTGAIQTNNPERTFAPLIEVAADEPWRPMSARWFIERSALSYTDDRRSCGSFIVAVGHTMPELQDSVTDWIYPEGLGAQHGKAYYRAPKGPNCDLDLDRRVFADQLVRPHDPGPREPEGAKRGEGFYLNLADDARSGPADRSRVPVYVERTDEGDSGARLTYWMLFGMHGTPGEPRAHEGEWKRIDLLLDDLGDGAYRPRTMQTDGLDGQEVPWGEVRHTGGTHPVVSVARATHALALATSRDRCALCDRWTSWSKLADAHRQPWYGFGGAWGDLGTSSATTGPLGPHGQWATLAEKARDGENTAD